MLRQDSLSVATSHKSGFVESMERSTERTKKCGSRAGFAQNQGYVDARGKFWETPELIQMLLPYLDPGSTKCQCKYRRLQLYYVRKRWLNLLDPTVAVVIIRKEDRWFNRKIPLQIDQTQRAPSGLRVAIGHHTTH